MITKNNTKRKNLQESGLEIYNINDTTDYTWKDEGVLGVVGGAVGKASPYIAIASLLLGFFKIMRDYATRTNRACIDLHGPEKALCKTEIELSGYNQGLAALKRARSQCIKTKDPEKCRKTIDKHILKITAKIEKLKVRNNSYQKIKMISDREKALAAREESMG
jgi:hypothetical protein